MRSAKWNTMPASRHNSANGKEQRGANREHVVLHYFDNFPTAAVSTRARRLRGYLAKRIARGEFLPHDSIALVGHSTGGLDIRRLLCDLVADQDADTRYPVDGTHGSRFTVSAADILLMVRRIVFLSVPQFGSNIADWVRGHSLGRQSWWPSSGPRSRGLKFQCWIGSRNASPASPRQPRISTCWRRSRMLCRRLNHGASQTACRTAMAQEAASEIALWLRHIASDFSAIDDLSADADGDAISPAHFTAQRRDDEKSRPGTNAASLRRSYATLGTRTFDFDPDHPAPPWDLLNPLSYPETTGRSRPIVKTDVTYRTCYRACAGGPFRYPSIKNLPTPPQLVDELGRQRTISVWDNDGIVNTASMLWPNGPQSVLVNADHMDIVGHFRRVRADGDSGRTYQAYDLLKSGSEFRLNKFAQVWKGIFDFCVS